MDRHSSYSAANTLLADTETAEVLQGLAIKKDKKGFHF
jgi:hypothetical protein